MTKDRSELRWQKQDTAWMLSLYGTAIGAGILFLPIDAGLNGFWPMIIMLILAFPMTYFSHLALCRFVLSSSKQHDITGVVQEYFGKTSGNFLTFLYFFAIYPIVLMYSVAITNTANSFIINQMGHQAPPRALLAFILILILMITVRFGQQFIVRLISWLVYPFVCVLMLIAISLIPHWNLAIIHSRTPNNNLTMTLWLLIPVIVFSFNHSPIISSFALFQKDRYGEFAEKKSEKILKYSHLIMLMTVMFFVFSCVLSLSPTDLVKAKEQNITILSYLANYLKAPVISFIAPIVAFIAIAKSFFGHYLGANEGLRGLLNKYFNLNITHQTKINLGIDFFMIVTCWLIATVNPNILKTIETLGGPIIAMILFLMPMYAIAKVPAMKKYQQAKLANIFITVMGIIAISAILYQFYSDS